MKSRATATLHTLGGALLTIALIRLTSTTSTLPYWETDPALQFIPETTLTPAMSLIFDALTWFLCAISLLVTAASGQRVRGWLVGAALSGGAVAIVHGMFTTHRSAAFFINPTGAIDLVRGSLWASSMIAAVTLAHLASDRSFKRLCLACLGGVALYLSAKGFLQVFVEHPRYLQEFDQNKDRILAAQGMLPGSSQAQIFERRVRQPEATGWGGLSNSYATVVAAGALAWLAITLFARKAVEKDRTGLLGVTAIAGLASLAALWFSGSRAGLGIALLVAIAIPLSTRFPKPLARWSIVGLCAAAVLGVIAQGTLGPDMGDLSIYFRALYWQGAAGVFADAPILGIGAGSFKDAFLLHRPRLCPEEVDSAHNVFIDWLTALGIFALPWIWIVCSLLVRTMRSVIEPTERDDGESGGGSRLALTLIVLAVFAWGAWLEWPLLLPDELFVRALGALLWIGAGATFFSLAPKLSPRAEPLIWAIIACAIAVHSMIEMTLSMNTTVMWGLAAIGVAGHIKRRTEDDSTLFMLLPAFLMVLVCSLIALAGLSRFPIESKLHDAALTLFSAYGHPVESRADLERRRDALARTTETLTPIAIAHPALMARSAELMIAQSDLLRGLGQDKEAAAELDRAVKLLRRASDRSGSVSFLLRLAVLRVETGDLERGFQDAHRAATLDPWGLEPATLEFELARRYKRSRDARAAALRLLEVHEAKRLDPLRGLSEAELAEVRAFLRSLEAPE